MGHQTPRKGIPKRLPQQHLARRCAAPTLLEVRFSAPRAGYRARTADSQRPPRGRRAGTNPEVNSWSCNAPPARQGSSGSFRSGIGGALGRKRVPAPTSHRHLCTGLRQLRCNAVVTHRSNGADGGCPGKRPRAAQVMARETVCERVLSRPAELKEVIAKCQVAGDRLSMTQRTVPALPMTIDWLSDDADWP